MVSIAPYSYGYGSTYDPAIEDVQSQIVELRNLESNLWAEVEMQRQYVDQLDYERSMLQMQLGEATARDAVHAAQLQNLLGNYEIEIARTKSDRDRLAALLHNTSEELRFKEETIISSETRLRDVEGILAHTQGNLAQWQSLYQEIQMRFADMQTQFESSRAAALQLTEIVRQKDMEMAAESARFNDLLRQKDAELGYANTLLRAKDEEITALRTQTIFTDTYTPPIVAPTIVADQFIAPATVVAETYETYTPRMEAYETYSTVAPTVVAAPAMYESMISVAPPVSSYVTESYVAPPPPMVTTTSTAMPQYSTVETFTYAPPVIPPPTVITETTYTPSILAPPAPMMMNDTVRPGRLKVLVTEGTDFSRKHRRPYVLLTVGSHTTHTHATKRDKQRHSSWNEMAEFDVQDATTEILRVSIAEKHRIRHDEKFAASRPIPLAQLPYNTPRSFTADTGLGRVNLQLELLPPPGLNNNFFTNGMGPIGGMGGSNINPLTRSNSGSMGYTPTHNHRNTTL
jgi:hypothetical protein